MYFVCQWQTFLKSLTGFGTIAVCSVLSICLKSVYFYWSDDSGLSNLWIFFNIRESSSGDCRHLFESDIWFSSCPPLYFFNNKKL